MGGPPEEPSASAGEATVLDRPAAPPLDDDPDDEDQPTPTEIDDAAEQRAAATGPPAPPVVPPSEPGPPTTDGPASSSATITTAIEAMRDEEVRRTRVFIRLGWLASVIGFASLPFVGGNSVVRVAFVVGLLVGIAVSAYYHQLFRDPSKYGPRPLLVLGVMCAINTHIVILFFGAFTLTPVFIVIGLHFVGRSELSARRAVYITSVICHGAFSIAMMAGWRDPGVFATARPLGFEAYAIGALYVQGAYLLAYYTGVRQRLLSLRAIEQLQRTTRVASQRAALLDELRADLARAQQGGSGRYTDQELGGYKLGSVLGRGSHGEVYEAVAIAGGEPAAVKVLHRDQLVDRTTVARFLREANVTATIGSSHVCKLLAVSESAAAVPFIAMERLRGSTLSDMLRRKGNLTRAELVALVTQVGDGLDAVHARGVVHRDLKPQNLFLDGLTWKILDFGVAALDKHSGTLTRGNIIGTPHYMAPEQARGEQVDHRADLYALGAVAYRTLTGRNAFGGGDTTAILYQVIHKMPPRPSALTDVVPDVDRWVSLAIAKDPEARPPSGKQLAAWLTAALRGELPQAQRDAADQLVDSSPWQELS